jgi:glutamine---fructose-6-phosphate transaminase (isomerizing)
VVRVCGIVGYIGRESVAPFLLQSLKRLEYRGYDSAGIALIEQGQLVRFRRAGKVRDLEADLAGKCFVSTVGIGHTRWATHGAPTDHNAHPHADCSGRIAVIHNGIIENHSVLRQQLQNKGHSFSSQTDTEVLAHLIESLYDGDLLAAVRHAVAQAEGAFAVAVLSQDEPDRIVVAKRGSPLVVGRGNGASYVSSDVPALLGRASEVQFLVDDEVGELTLDGYRVFTLDGRPVHRPPHRVSMDPVAIQKGGYKHFMLKEIHEQPRSVGETIREKVDQEASAVLLPSLDGVPPDFDHVYFVACGTAFHAAKVAEYLWEDILPVPTHAVIASEFRLRNPHITPRTLVVAVSQSGETIDTLMAVRLARARGAHVIALVNGEQSAIERESNCTVYTRAGIEIGVAATKTFSAQIAALGLVGLALARLRRADVAARTRSELSELALLPGRIVDALRVEDRVRELAKKLHRASDVLYLARGVLYPIALEGALKLKEISYIHAEGYPAGEMKHGPIALIDEGTPVLMLAARGPAYDKLLSNMEEVKARKGLVIAVSDSPDDPNLARLADEILPVPAASGVSTPVLFTIPLQLLAYYVAVDLGTDVDQPRNLAKTVTVE